MNNYKNAINADFYKISGAILMTGFGAGLASYLLHQGVDLLSHFVGTNLKFNLTTYCYAIALALISFILSKKLFPDTNGSGIPQVKLSLIAYKGKMPRRMPFGKFLTSLFTLASGLSFGKEGPLVTISASWGHLVSHVFNLNRQLTKVIVASGATAGLAAAFNTPIAAVVFTIEEILGELNTKYLGPIIVTSVIASVTSYKLLGNKATFVPLHYGFHIEWHLLLYLALGLLMSLLALVFVKFILVFKDIKKKYFSKVDFLFVIFAVVLTGLFSNYSTDLLGDGTNIINTLILGKSGMLISTLGIIFVLKLLLISTAYSTGLSGGIFMPVLFMGAIGGTLFGTLLIKLGVSNIEVGAFALLGMTSLLVAMIRTPFTAFVMLFEMTRDYELILPLMVSSIAAYWFSTIINPESVYESVAEYEGVHLPTSNDNECLNEMSVEECMVSQIVSLKLNDTVEDAVEKINTFDFGGFPVIKSNKLVGVVNPCELKEKVESESINKLSDVVRYTLITIYPDQSLLVALDKMKRFELGRLFVVSRFNDKQLVGVITPKDIVNYLGLSKQA